MIGRSQVLNEKTLGPRTLYAILVNATWIIHYFWCSLAAETLHYFTCNWCSNRWRELIKGRVEWIRVSDWSSPKVAASNYIVDLITSERSERSSY